MWDSAQHVVFERGVTFRKVFRRWLCTTAEQVVCGITPQEFLNRSDFRPVCVEIDHPSKPIVRVMAQDSDRPLDVRVNSAIYSRNWDRSHYLKHLRIANAEYCLGLLLHQCKRLAATYSATLEHLLVVAERQDDGRLQMSRQFEVYYDFDEVITAGIRALDSFRAIIWHGFQESGSVPRSFTGAVASASRMPSDLRQLVASLQPLFNEAKEFRDCIQHYFSPGVHTDFADLQKVGVGFWTLTAWLPDNVQTRSALKFTYNRSTDALSFAWDFVNRIVFLFEAIAAQVAPETNIPSE